jgi:hypothetical protein
MCSFSNSVDLDLCFGGWLVRRQRDGPYANHVGTYRISYGVLLLVLVQECE